MQTTILQVDPNRPDAESMTRAAAVLRAGGLVAFPTETVYGLGANALDPQAVERIFAAKGRPANNPLIVHVDSIESAQQLTTSWPTSAARLAATFWPGPLTVVLHKQATVPDMVTASGPTVAIRLPAAPVARALLAAAGVPIAAPSANRSSRLSPTRAEHVLADLNGALELLLDGGPTTGGLESTVIDLTTTPPRLLRPGLITPDAIEAVIGPLQRLETSQPSTTTAPLPSPGMLSRHYAPRTPLECVVGSGRERVEALARQGRIGWLSFASSIVEIPGVLSVPMPTDPSAYAAQLYAVLHGLDEANLDRIIVELPPEQDAWLAIRDRLRRATSV